MPDRPITFSAPMVQALLAGRKTMTRRLLKEQRYVATARLFGGRWQWFGTSGAALGDVAVSYAPGDRLWVREAWRTDRAYDDLRPSDLSGEEPLIYLADNEVQRWGWKPDFLSRWGRYRHARFMPRWASRLTLHVYEVRVQRLQEISHQDAIHEGVQCHTCTAMQESACHGRGCPAARATFGTLWNSIHGDDAWDANPWVSAITFTVERANIDQGRQE